MRLNLRPRTMRRREEWEKRWPPLAAAAACFLLGLMAWSLYYWRSADFQRRTAAQLEEKVDALRRFETEINQVKREIASLDRLGGPLVSAIDDRAFWPVILDDLNARLPKQDIWITELLPTSGGKPLAEARTIRATAAPATTVSPPRSGATPAPLAIDGLLVRGLYLFNPRQQEVAVDYFKNLVGSPWFALDPKNQARAIKPTTPNDTEWAFPYELRLDLRKTIALP